MVEQNLDLNVALISQKLLWAVSQALQSKQISVKHEQFKTYASSLARVVKRLFLEFNDQTVASTSEKLLR